ncbi:hypothetical protein [Streptomyces xanthii]|uniref:Uncharacterized protein n=1 Tax=Streptomyces xanthii TaxID=2768069 RepID=A0A7H1BAC7_9ACTN|nr:hypothetical protein [Streptomyces xanthii]QNS05682.1 hypothetical protein IAG42_20205 [Streptomyces xanthii]
MTRGTNGTNARRGFGDWIWFCVLAVTVMFAGLVIGVLGPLLAISCSTCQDGVGDVRGGDTLLVLAQGVVPLVTLGTVLAIFLPKGGTRAAAVGFGVLVVLFVVMQVLGA